jgi:hypothetical protein
VTARLAARGLYPRNAALEETAGYRAKAAVQELGPELFPLITQAEVRLTSTRPLNGGGTLPDHYQMAGVVDVITHVSLAAAHHLENRIVASVADALTAGVSGEYEVIVDYKGMRRPPLDGGNGYRQIYEWQVQTYAQLRRQQPDSLPVAAGVLLYLNELGPTWTDLAKLRKEIEQGSTDVLPAPGSPEEQAVMAKRPRGASVDDIPALPFEFRLARAIHVVPVSPASQRTAAAQFDHWVIDIEQAKAAERDNGTVLGTWEQYARDEETCAACDFRVTCPSRTNDTEPSLPRQAR